MMQLKDFVAETLRQIIAGVCEAREYAKGHGGAKVVPAMTSYGRETVLDDETKNPVQMIDFDVAVTATESSERKGGGSVSVMGFSIGGGGQANVATQSVSRIKFVIPVSLWHDAGPAKIKQPPDGQA